MDSHSMSGSRGLLKPHIPHSSATVDVRAIDTGTRILLNPGLFWEPVLPGFDGLRAPVYSFLISHGNRHVLFDLGVRVDWKKLAPKIVQIVEATTEVFDCTKDVPTVLDNDASGFGVRSRDIESIILSHTHWDHIGDPSLFPSSTELVVGPGVSRAAWPGYPSNCEGGVLDSDAQDRNVREIKYSGVTVGGFDAYDFFGDGSFYLLDAPGHALGHLCALAQTKSEPPSFVFLGADACHHPGVLRPTAQLPLPRETVECSEEIIDRIKLWQDPDRPFFRVAKGRPTFPDHDAATKTVAKMRALDALGNVLILLAHDASLQHHLPLFPRTLNDWQERNLACNTRWLFCSEFERVKMPNHHEA